jgi:PAS domain S-box-containing protein
MSGTEATRQLWPFRALFEAAQHGVAVCDADGRITAWNAAAERLIGSSAAEATGRDLAWLHERDEHPWPAEALARAAGGEAVVHRGWRIAADGSRFWCEATLRAMPDDDGGAAAYVETFDDMTHVKTARDTLDQVPELFVQALRTAPIGLATQDAELRYTWMPMGPAGLGGIHEGDPVGCDDHDLYPPGAAARLVALKRQVVASGRGMRTEFSVAREGGQRHFDVTLEPLHDDRGAVTGVSTVAYDISDRRRIQDEVERSRARLAEAEHVAQLGSWEWDIAANRVVWSDGLFAIYGIDPDEWEPEYRPGSERIFPDDRELVDDAVRQALKTCEPIDLEYRILRPDGRVRRVRGRAEVIVDANGEPVRFAGTVQDITEVRATAEALEQTAADLGRRAAELHRVSGPTGAERRHALTPGLTARQLEILGLVSEGMSNAEIADRLFLSEGTVKWHVRKILKALGVTNRAQAVARYLATFKAPD